MPAGSEVIAVMFGPTLSTPALRDMLVTSMRGLGLVDAVDGRAVLLA